jgi:hypothetical protein
LPFRDYRQRNFTNLVLIFCSVEEWLYPKPNFLNYKPNYKNNSTSDAVDDVILRANGILDSGAKQYHRNHGFTSDLKKWTPGFSYGSKDPEDVKYTALWDIGKSSYQMDWDADAVPVWLTPAELEHKLAQKRKAKESKKRLLSVDRVMSV